MTDAGRRMATLFALALPFCAIAQDTHGDEARIEVLLRAERGARPAHATAAPAKTPVSNSDASVAMREPEGDFAASTEAAELKFDDLRQLRGKAVRIVSIGGGVRVGTVEAATRQKVTLNVRMGGGFARYDLARDRVQSVRLLRR